MSIQIMLTLMRGGQFPLKTIKIDHTWTSFPATSVQVYAQYLIDSGFSFEENDSKPLIFTLVLKNAGNTAAVVQCPTFAQYSLQFSGAYWNLFYSNPNTDGFYYKNGNASAKNIGVTASGNSSNGLLVVSLAESTTYDDVELYVSWPFE